MVRIIKLVDIYFLNGLWSIRLIKKLARLLRFEIQYGLFHSCLSNTLSCSIYTYRYEQENLKFFLINFEEVSYNTEVKIVLILFSLK
jgi:hypothetical protein